VVPALQGDEVDVLVGCGAGGLPHLDASLLGEAGGVHVADRLLAHSAEHALQDRQGEDPGVGVRQLALVADL
jgi:hypothetical protein